MVEAEATKICERCGTFAVLESNGFRELCEVCWKTNRHRLELRLTSIPELAETLVRLFAEFWKPTLALALLKAAPIAIWQSQRELSPAISTCYQWAVGSFFEVILITLIGLSVMGNVTDVGKILRAALPRYFATVGVNVITNLMVVGGMVLLCVPAIPVMAICFPAIVIAVLEGKSPPRAVLESFRRSRPIFWKLAFFAAALLTVAMVPTLIGGAIKGYSEASGRPISAELAAWMRVATEAAGALLNIPGILFQLVAWGATRPPPPAVTPLVHIAA